MGLEFPALRALDLLNAPERGVTISAIVGRPCCNRTGLCGKTNQSPQDAVQLAVEKEFCAWRLPADASAYPENLSLSETHSARAACKRRICRGYWKRLKVV